MPQCDHGDRLLAVQGSGQFPLPRRQIEPLDLLQRGDDEHQLLGAGRVEHLVCRHVDVSGYLACRQVDDRQLAQTFQLHDQEPAAAATDNVVKLLRQLDRAAAGWS